MAITLSQHFLTSDFPCPRIPHLHLPLPCPLQLAPQAHSLGLGGLASSKLPVTAQASMHLNTNLRDSIHQRVSASGGG